MKSNSLEAFQIQHEMMTISGAWPYEVSSFGYKIKGILNYSISVVLILTMILEAAHDINDFVKLSEILYLMVAIMVYLCKHGGFFLQRKPFIRIVKLLNHPAFFTYPDELDTLMVRRIKFSQILVKLYRFSVFGYVLMLGITPIFDKNSLPVPFPYDLGRYKFLMYIFQLTAVGVNGWNNSCFDSIAACLMGLADTHLEILAQRLIKLRQEIGLIQSDEIVVKKLKECIEHHIKIIELVEGIDQVFSIGVLSQFTGSIIIICNTLLHLILVSIGSSQFFMLLIYLNIMITQLLLYCWFGNEVIWKSRSIGDACYAFEWYKHGTEVRKYLFIIMERSRRPLTITAYKFSTLSLTTFSSIMQWSYSYFALLIKLYDKRT